MMVNLYCLHQRLRDVHDIFAVESDTKNTKETAEMTELRNRGVACVAPHAPGHPISRCVGGVGARGCRCGGESTKPEPIGLEF